MELSMVRDELVRMRKSLKITQWDIANALGIRQSAVSRFESHHVKDPGLSTIKRYAEAFGAKVECQLIPPPPVPRTQEEKVAFRKDWDRRVEEGKR